jgi:hypothetical protein
MVQMAGHFTLARSKSTKLWVQKIPILGKNYTSFPASVNINSEAMK